MQCPPGRATSRSGKMAPRWFGWVASSILGHFVIGFWCCSPAVGFFATCLPPPGGHFAAFTYALAYLVVTSAREFIDSSFSMPNNDHRYAGIPT